ncbi:hem peroxidase [Dillenia turbinata]|uniref:Peroxidase n=1 Tax=Dillenia turbinata TaxID=194707 RepID=A0AAN8VE29_9MAGN
MGSQKFLACFFLHFFLLLLVFRLSVGQGLRIGFYSTTCPNAEAIVKKSIDQVMAVAPSLAGPLLRMHFHDCFIRVNNLPHLVCGSGNVLGCDGSILLNSSTHQAEKDAIPNLSLRGYGTIDRVKSALEKECPGIVSCADVLAIVARDVVVATKGPYYEVETGRRDGRVSNLADANNLLPPFANITTLKLGFQARGLSVKDLVVLSGGHTIGTSHCSSFSNRLYDFSGKGETDTDPTLDPNYIIRLKTRCRSLSDTTTLVEMDPGSFKTFDTSYYALLPKRRGLFQSDAALLDDSETRAYVHEATTDGSSFFKDFGVSMVNMGRIGALTSSQGEIRRVCYNVNY